MCNIDTIVRLSFVTIETCEDEIETKGVLYDEIELNFRVRIETLMSKLNLGSHFSNRIVTIDALGCN